MFAQISPFFDNVFSKYRCGFRKGYSTQHCKYVRKDKVFDLLKTNLWKEFYSLDHKLLTVKVDVYSFNLPALCLIYEIIVKWKTKKN